MSDQPTHTSIVKRKPGRPRKNADTTAETTAETSVETTEETHVEEMDSLDTQDQQDQQHTQNALELYEISKCIYQHDNIVIEYKESLQVIKFLLLTAIKAVTCSRSQRVFEPIPYSWIEYMQQNGATTPDKYNFAEVIKEFKLNLCLDTIISAIESSYSDLEIIEKIGEQTYCFVKFVLMSNNTMINPYSLLTSADVINIEPSASASASAIKTKISQIEMNATIQQYKVIHTPLKEDQFKDADTLHLYHGTRTENVYSIMRNGLQSGSDREDVLNGTAHGKGMYFSKSIDMSLGYSTNVLFIFEVKKNPAKNDWKKTESIYVVDDVDAVILRYILCFNNSDPASAASNKAIFAAIDRKLNAGKIKEFEKATKDIASRNTITIHNKRIMREYAKLKKEDPQKLGFNTLLAEEDNLKVWIIHLFQVDNTVLEEQMRRLGIPYIEIEITFKENYPFEPPFIRIVHPHFKFRTGHITSGGSLCMEMLTSKVWQPAWNIADVITQIKITISDGGGEIDGRCTARYTKDNAIATFNLALQTHGWV